MLRLERDEVAARREDQEAGDRVRRGRHQHADEIRLAGLRRQLALRPARSPPPRSRCRARGTRAGRSGRNEAPPFAIAVSTICLTPDIDRPDHRHPCEQRLARPEHAPRRRSPGASAPTRVVKTRKTTTPDARHVLLAEPARQERRHLARRRTRAPSAPASPSARPAAPPRARSGSRRAAARPEPGAARRRRGARVTPAASRVAAVLALGRRPAAPGACRCGGRPCRPPRSASPERLHARRRRSGMWPISLQHQPGEGGEVARRRRAHAEDRRPRGRSTGCRPSARSRPRARPRRARPPPPCSGSSPAMLVRMSVGVASPSSAPYSSTTSAMCSPECGRARAASGPGSPR